MVGRATVRMPEPMVFRKDTPARRIIIREALLREIAGGRGMEASSLIVRRLLLSSDG